MEEQKKKEVKNEDQQKLSYEKLSEIADNLFNENRYLKQQLQQAEKYIQTFNRLDYLFKVLDVCKCESQLYKFDSDFVAKCVNEIQEVMTIPEKEETNEEN